MCAGSKNRVPGHFLSQLQEDAAASTRRTLTAREARFRTLGLQRGASGKWPALFQEKSFPASTEQLVQIGVGGQRAPGGTVSGEGRQGEEG